MELHHRYEVHVHLHIGEVGPLITAPLTHALAQGFHLLAQTMHQEGHRMDATMQQIVDLAQAQGATIDALSTSVEGVVQDIQLLKDRIDQGGTVTAQELQGLLTTMSGNQDKLTTIQQKAADLDSQTP